MVRLSYEKHKKNHFKFLVYAISHEGRYHRYHRSLPNYFSLTENIHLKIAKAYFENLNGIRSWKRGI